MNIAILGAGNIAATMATTLQPLKNVTCYAVASRDKKRAQAFADKFGFQVAYGSYIDMLHDPNVHLVYIATPHSHHYETMKLCVERHKNILCEKPITVNANQLKEIKQLAKDNGVFLAEALWPRYMPSRKMINDILETKVIGEPKMLTANLCFVIHEHARLMDKNLAGGALLDIGIYGLNFALMFFGDDIKKIDSSVEFTETGVDGHECITLRYNDGRMAVLTHDIFSRSDERGVIYGSNGYISVDYILNPQTIDVYDIDGNLIQHYNVPKQISGYEYEMIECMKCVEEGKLEADSIKLDESSRMMEIMDSIRKDWGLKYPIE